MLGNDIKKCLCSVWITPEHFWMLKTFHPPERCNDYKDDIINCCCVSTIMESFSIFQIAKKKLIHVVQFQIACSFTISYTVDVVFTLSYWNQFLLHHICIDDFVETQNKCWTVYLKSAQQRIDLKCYLFIVIDLPCVIYSGVNYVDYHFCHFWSGCVALR